VGTYHLVATYGGSADFYGSTTSATTTLTVVKQFSKTALKLSAGKATSGHEQSETLSVSVSPLYAGATPTGKVTVRKSTTTLCVITLSKGSGSCKLAPSVLRAGSYRLQATYGGDKDLAISSSSKKTLTISA
jgi:hypothetical protein